MSVRPLPLEPSFVEKVWGSTKLSPWFADSERKIGEVWFPAEEILVKFLFTTDRLSVQVHPPGKTEMWYILRAEPGAGIALGFRAPFPKERLREAAVTGEIERLLEWFPAAPGDVLLNRPGTVHALGGGLVLCEIQQNYPVTYRLYDYGRPRELQLEEAIEAARCERHPGKSQPADLGGGVTRLVACEHFVTDRLRFTGPAVYRPDRDRYHLLIATEGEGSIDGQPLAAGQLWRVPAAGEPFEIRPAGPLELLRTFVP
jgi:mannose-6-phosphate isomerase